MFAKSVKTILASAVVMTGAVFSTTGSANAGGNFGVYIGGGHNGGIYFGTGGHHKGYGHKTRHRPKYSHGYHHKKGRCGPRRALRKAWRMGLHDPHIARVNHRAIAVVGYNHGYRAKVVFKRHSKHCKVIKTRGLY